MFLPILFRYLPEAYQLLSRPKLCTLSWHSTACWSWLLHIPYFLDPSQWSLCMFPHPSLAKKGCYFQDGSSACSGVCHLQIIPWTAVVITVPHSPAHLCPTWTYDVFRHFVKVRRCQNWHTQFSTKWMLCHEMCGSILHTTQTYCQAIVKSLDPWKKAFKFTLDDIQGAMVQWGSCVNACDDFFCLLHYHHLWTFLNGFHVSSLKHVSGIVVISTMWTRVCIIYIYHHHHHVRKGGLSVLPVP
jgi:hypothetical protein